MFDYGTVRMVLSIQYSDLGDCPSADDVGRPQRWFLQRIHYVSRKLGTINAASFCTYLFTDALHTTGVVTRLSYTAMTFFHKNVTERNQFSVQAIIFTLGSQKRVPFITCQESTNKFNSPVYSKIPRKSTIDSPTLLCAFCHITEAGKKSKGLEVRYQEDIVLQNVKESEMLVKYQNKCVCEC